MLLPILAAVQASLPGQYLYGEMPPEQCASLMVDIREDAKSLVSRMHHRHVMSFDRQRLGSFNSIVDVVTYEIDRFNICEKSRIKKKFIDYSEIGVRTIYGCFDTTRDYNRRSDREMLQIQAVENKIKARIVKGLISGINDFANTCSLVRRDKNESYILRSVQKRALFPGVTPETISETFESEERVERTTTLEFAPELEIGAYGWTVGGKLGSVEKSGKREVSKKTSISRSISVSAESCPFIEIRKVERFQDIGVLFPTGWGGTIADQSTGKNRREFLYSDIPTKVDGIAEQSDLGWKDLFLDRIDYLPIFGKQPVANFRHYLGPDVLFENPCSPEYEQLP